MLQWKLKPEHLRDTLNKPATTMLLQEGTYSSLQPLKLHITYNPKTAELLRCTSSPTQMHSVSSPLTDCVPEKQLVSLFTHVLACVATLLFLERTHTNISFTTITDERKHCR
ncbi:hypothetical protein FQA47_011407 [Oryzias melastigma]|uniref:Uncharacterized protein n=1 Tax=Oryzias melastigma TaxID=30732 RepID=A0A834CCU9_ORYME|nr:hypothetical protein FQA47_011398 [Oryzias melastigma]KAF6725394.1 hypothetical protein FQA47_011407 [Oryzias melastigma]